MPLVFQNTSMYALGEAFHTHGDFNVSEGEGSGYFSHDYYQGNDYAFEDYQYGESDVPNSTRTIENFSYYLDESTMLINNIDMRVEINTYDAQGRKDLDHFYEVYMYDDQIYTYERKEDFFYSDPNAEHYRLEYSTEESTYTSLHDDGYSDYSTETWSFTYEYTGLDNSDIDDEDIYSVRRGTGTVSYEDSYGDSFVFNAIQKLSVSESRDSYSEYALQIYTNDDGLITYSSVESEMESRNGETEVEVEVYDFNADGIIDETNEWRSREQGNNSMYTYTDKYDYDGDGNADYIVMVKERESRQGISTTEYVYDADSSNRPTLEITKSIDTNFDGIPDSETQNTVFRTLSPRQTAMNDHVATVAIVLL